MKCEHCPIGTEGRDCLGERNPRVCQNVDPESPTFLPGLAAKLLAFVGVGPTPERRRAMEPRIPLGTKPASSPGGG